MLRVGTMMLGEIDFIGTFLRPLQVLRDPTHYIYYQTGAAVIFLIVFAILMPILLMNLLIGLAVGDIETVRRMAQLKRLTMQVQLHTDLERKLPKKFLKIVDKIENEAEFEARHQFIWDCMIAELKSEIINNKIH